MGDRCNKACLMASATANADRNSTETYPATSRTKQFSDTSNISVCIRQQTLVKETQKFDTKEKDEVTNYSSDSSCGEEFYDSGSDCM